MNELAEFEELWADLLKFLLEEVFNGLHIVVSCRLNGLDPLSILK